MALADAISVACAVVSGFNWARCTMALRPYFPRAVSMRGKLLYCRGRDNKAGHDSFFFRRGTAKSMKARSFSGKMAPPG